MAFSLCIHGHFYQPPRENPWFGEIFPEPSAAPAKHWNERIVRESYAPLAYARQCDEQGRIFNILNAYEWISFNFGPTLLTWIARTHPELLRRIQEGDKKSRERLGYGNAIAQIYHHIIMPLATEADKRREVRWAIDNFKFYFHRKPEGMWLSECAVDLPTLEVLADEGIQFVILSPYQAHAVIVDGETRLVHEHGINIAEPYSIKLANGKSIAAFFYNGPLSQSIAFEGLLADGERFWQRILGESRHFSSTTGKPLLGIATDGETYGHHFKFGEMALAYVLSQASEGRDGVELHNFASYLAACPPQKEVELLKVSAWSCAHGVERWRSDCGCKDGGHPDWTQGWRRPLRDALDIMKNGVETHYQAVGKRYFTDPAEALLAYGKVLADPAEAELFLRTWYKGKTTETDTAWKLLQMQEQSLAAYASCAWFFDDISRIEPQNAMTYALHALELLEETGGKSLMDAFQTTLDNAHSNNPVFGTGKDIFQHEVVARKDSDASLCLMACTRLALTGAWPKNGSAALVVWPAVTVSITPKTRLRQGQVRKGTAIVKAPHELHGRHLAWTWYGPQCCFAEETVDMTRLQESSLEAVPAEGAPSTVTINALSRTLQDELLRLVVCGGEAGRRTVMRGQARNILSLFPGFVEAQQTMIGAACWQGVIPYLILETALVKESLTSEQADALVAFIQTNRTPIIDELTQRILEEELITCFTSDNVPDEDLARIVSMMKKVFPEMVFWRVQNVFWDYEKFLYTKFAFSLGFR